ncbi:MAG: septal ring lytic transglycosylase RlpA family protein [Gammaproteobacteria bacterium]|nr:septal ring lytic transglycosylase RlpA family protein [Gammaproteobacteria bacterium]
MINPVYATLFLAALFSVLFGAGCSSRGPLETADYPPPDPQDISHIQDAVPRAEPLSRYGNPASYVVNGKRYYTKPSSRNHKERGIASWYGTKFHGRRTSSGEVYDIYKMTAAHKSLPLPTYARVTNLRNGRSVVVKVNDRGPFHNNRIIDLSYVAAAKLGILEYGTGLVEVEAIDTPATTRAGATAPTTPSEAAVVAITSSAPPQAGLRQASLEQPVSADAINLFIQVGAFRDRGNAERMKERLDTADLGPVRIVTKTAASNPLYRVQVGPLASVGEVDRIANNLISLGISDTQVIID